MNRGKKANVSEAAKPAVDARRPGKAALSPELQAHIGRSLKALYDGLVNEPVPPHFLDLLDKLEKAEDSGLSTADDSAEPRQ
jgi:hypothetical protein